MARPIPVTRDEVARLGAGDQMRLGPAVQRLRMDLAAVDYATEAIDALLGDVASAALHREQLLPARRVAAADEPLAIVVRLFTLGVAVSVADIDRALPACGVAGLVELELVEPADADDDGDQLMRATCDLRPYGDEQHRWWVASDLSETVTGRALPQDHVLGIGGASTTLASWTPRRTAARALDVGTGCGVQALHLLSHAGQVVATDLSLPALGYARFNAALNEVDLDLRAGSLLEPIGPHEVFDLVVSNPPFVITPRTEEMPAYEYRDGGMTGDSLVQRLIRDLPGVLAPGGVAQLLANWEVPRGGDWREVVGGWIAGTGLDAWVVQRDEQDPAQYAELWAGDGGHGHFEASAALYDQMYTAWLEDFAARDVERIGFGIVTLQRPTNGREPFVDLVEVTGPVAATMGPTIDAGLRARTALAEGGDAYLLEQRWRVASDVTEERHGFPGSQDPSVILLRQGGGLGTAIQLDTALAAFVSVCDGELIAAAALDAIAELIEQDAASLRARLLPRVAALVADGLLQI
ncbi:MAG: methyltransferase [Actinomycetota bacterium]|nr:methyltransferase [Actinomycetota bacterium]